MNWIRFDPIDILSKDPAMRLAEHASGGQWNVVAEGSYLDAPWDELGPVLYHLPRHLCELVRGTQRPFSDLAEHL